MLKLVDTPFSNLRFEDEANKFAILRIIFSSFLMHRYWEIYLATNHLAVDAMAVVYIKIILVLSLLSMIGFLMPISLFALNALVVYTDKQLGIYNLGTAGFSNVAFLLLFSQSAYKFSIDSLLLKSRSFSRVLYPPSWRSSDSLATTLLCSYIIFGLVNLASGVGHILDPFWLNGQALQVTFQNPFYSRYFIHISTFALSYSLAYEALCLTAEFFQLIWQILMIPLIFFRWGQIFVLAWGGIFIGLSLIFLKLSYLSGFLIILWVALFFNHNLSNYMSPIYLQPRRLLNIFKQPPAIVAAPFISLFLLASSVTAVQLAYTRINVEKTSAFRYDLVKQNLPEIVTLSFDISALVGLLTPNVFNTPDVLAAKKFVFLERLSPSSKSWKLVPFIGYMGERLHYNTNNLIYYGVSIPLRRCIQVNELDDCSAFIQKIVQYDKSINRENGSQYRLTLIEDKKTVLEKIL